MKQIFFKAKKNLSLFIFAFLIPALALTACKPGQESQNYLQGFLAAALGSGGPNGNTQSPTVTYSSGNYSFPAGILIAAITPAITAGPLTNCVATPPLPDGLVIEKTTCTISGMPTTIQSEMPYMITASNDYGTGNTTISITVTSAGTAPAVHYSGSPYSFEENLTIATMVPTLTGNTPTNCTSSPGLPVGLSINATDCSISGTPVIAQSLENYTITASNDYGSGTATIGIEVVAAGTAPTIGYSGTPYSFTQGTVITTLTPTLGGSAPTDCTSSPTLPAGITINATSCAISGTPTAVQSANDYTITASNAYGSATTTINIEVVAAGTAPTINYSGSPYSFTQDVAITTISPAMGGSAPTGCTSSPALPAGLNVHATSCAISGTPTTVQSVQDYTITASNAFGNGSATINIEVIAAGTAPTVSYTGSPYNFTQNSAIATVTPTLGGSTPTGCASSPDLPAGLSLNPTSCAISGIPTVEQAATAYTISVSNSFGTGNDTIVISIAAAMPDAPTGVSAIGGNGKITITWDPVDVATSYNIYWSTSPGVTTGSGTKISDVTSPFTHSGLSNGTSYYYIVTAVNTGLESVASGEADDYPYQSSPLIKTYQSQCWDASGTLIPCAGTGQDGDIQAGRDVDFTGPVMDPTNTTQYTTTDNITGLIWKTCPQGKSGPTCAGTPYDYTTWSAVLNSCDSLNHLTGYAGRTGWRVPTLYEVQTVINYSTPGATAFAANFPGLPAYFDYFRFITTTDYTYNPFMVWMVDSVTGRLLPYSKDHSGPTGNILRCVTSGP